MLDRYNKLKKETTECDCTGDGLLLFIVNLYHLYPDCRSRTLTNEISSIEHVFEHLRWVSSREPMSVLLGLWPGVNDLTHTAT